MSSGARAALAAALFSAVLLASGGDSAVASGPPKIADVWVTDVTTDSASVWGEIEPEGLSTTYRFEYLKVAQLEAGGWEGASFAPSSGSAPFGSQPSPPAFQRLLHLAAGTEYAFRLRATKNAGGPPTFSPAHLLRTESPSAGPSACPQALRLGPSAALPDCRAYELVSPLAKAGGSIVAPGQLFGGGLAQAAAAGSAIAFASPTAFADPLSAPPLSQYRSDRTSNGWQTANLDPPAAAGAYGEHPDGSPFRMLTADLSTALFAGGEPCLGPGPSCPDPTPVLAGSGAPAGYRALYRRSPGGELASLLTPADVANSSIAPSKLPLALVGATPDLTHVLISSCAALTADAVEVPDGAGGCDPKRPNLYEASQAGLVLVNSLPGKPSGTPAAPLGAVSEDGGRVYWRDQQTSALWLFEAGHAERALSPAGEFQASSADGSIAYFLHGEELWRYSVSSEASLLIADSVSGVLAVSPDGSTVYFQDAAGLERWRSGGVELIAAGADVAGVGDTPPASATVALSPDGEHFAFLSAAPIPPFENTDADTGLPDTELYLYGPPPAGGAAILRCASCNPTGERPQGSASIPGTIANGSLLSYRPRVLSGSGNRLFFESSDRLATSDTNSRTDVYQWEAGGEGDCQTPSGCVDLISTGRGQGATFLDASADGSDAYFLTGESILPLDPGSSDVYDARIDGGFPEPETPIPCKGDACQPLPSPPDDPKPGTTVPNSGNPPVKYYKPPRKHHHHKHKRQHPRHRGHR